MKTAGTIAIAATVAILIIAFHPSQADGIRWGQMESGTITSISTYEHGIVYSITMGHDSEGRTATGMITTVGDCGNLKVGDVIWYQTSSIDPAIGTQRMKIIQPANCTAGINGLWN